MMAELLGEVPGGVVINDSRAVWPDLGMELTIPGVQGVAARSVGSCNTGKICAYDDTNRKGRLLTWSICGTILVPAAFAVESAANARTSGSVRLRNGTSVVETIAANSWSNVSGAVTSLLCVL
ncbi:hypothetical protein [Microbacterium sp. PMB16]|uniref:hypothetical protein n=1 Tax=Microbacterium sp. PMB16 TaxID=3120157 RepID=UPI003F4BB011